MADTGRGDQDNVIHWKRTTQRHRDGGEENNPVDTSILDVQPPES